MTQGSMAQIPEGIIVRAPYYPPREGNLGAARDPLGFRGFEPCPFRYKRGETEAFVETCGRSLTIAYSPALARPDGVCRDGGTLC